MTSFWLQISLNVVCYHLQNACSLSKSHYVNSYILIYKAVLSYDQVHIIWMCEWLSNSLHWPYNGCESGKKVKILKLGAYIKM